MRCCTSRSPQPLPVSIPIHISIELAHSNATGAMCVQTLTYGSGMLLLDGVNAVTPHWAGAVDIMAVRQRDGSIQSSPFYVRFGKYQSWRRNRQVCQLPGR